MPEQFSTALKIGNKIQIRISLETEFQSHQERAVKTLLENLPLADSMRNLLLSNNLLFRKYLHRVDTPRVFLAYLEDPAERPTADKLEEFEVAWR